MCDDDLAFRRKQLAALDTVAVYRYGACSGSGTIRCHYRTFVVVISCNRRHLCLLRPKALTIGIVYNPIAAQSNRRNLQSI